MKHTCTPRYKYLHTHLLFTQLSSNYLLMYHNHDDKSTTNLTKGLIISKHCSENTFKTTRIKFDHFKIKIWLSKDDWYISRLIGIQPLRYLYHSQYCPFARFSPSIIIFSVLLNFFYFHFSSKSEDLKDVPPTNWLRD